MNGIENIIKRIGEEAKLQAEQIMAQANEEASAIRKEYSEKGEELKSSIVERGKKSAAERENRLCGVAGLEARKATLAKKQELISRAFDAAVAKLESLDDDAKAEALASLALKAANGRSGEIILSAKDRKAIGDKILAKCEANKNIVLSAGTREIGGGMILKDGAAEVNCTFETLVSQQRDTLSREVADILFG